MTMILFALYTSMIFFTGVIAGMLMQSWTGAVKGELDDDYPPDDIRMGQMARLARMKPNRYMKKIGGHLGS